MTDHKKDIADLWSPCLYSWMLVSLHLSRLPYSVGIVLSGSLCGDVIENHIKAKAVSGATNIEMHDLRSLQALGLRRRSNRLYLGILIPR